MFANVVKDYIRSQVSEPIASIYCKQFEDVKQFADFLEYMSKQYK